MNKILFVFIIFMMILSISNISALGITPGRTTINFKPMLEKRVDFTIVNSEEKNISLSMYARGELSESISIVGEESFSMSTEEHTKKMSYDISLPGELDPGLHTADIVVVQAPEGSGAGKASVGAALAVVTQLYVYVPYPGKYVVSELKISGPENKKKFHVLVDNRGSEDVNEVYADILIYNMDNEKVKELKTSTIPLKSGERKEISVEWEVDVEDGKYLAKAIIDYDGNQGLSEKYFEVGELILDLQQIFVENFRLGEIAEFNLVVQNKWNELIENAYAEMRIFDNEMNEIDSFKTATYNIPAGMQTTMQCYWDTENISAGVYNGNVILYYVGKKTQQDLKLDVREDRIIVFGLGYVISEGAEAKDGGLIMVLIILVGFLILINLLWFLILRKKIRKRRR